MSEPSHTCHVCCHVFPTEDESDWLQPPCCPQCLAPRRMLSPDRHEIPPSAHLELSPSPFAAWLLSLYGHIESIETYGYLDNLLRTQARDEATVRAVLDGIRAIDIEQLVARLSAPRDSLSWYQSQGLDQALVDMVAESKAGILEWRLEQSERRAVAMLQAERRHHEAFLSERAKR
jgi:hypothetical protein